MPSRGLPLLTALVVALAGCRLPAGAGEECVEDRDCDETEDLGCWRNICQRFVAPTGPLAFEVIPRSSGGLGPVAFAPAGVDGLDLSVCPPSAVAGTVALPEDFPVDVEAVGTTAVPGLVRRLAVTLPADPLASAPRPFALRLPPARWTLRFTSRDGASPPLAAAVDVPGCGRVSDLAVAPRGRYAREIPIRFGPGPLGHCGASVQVLDPATGEPLSARVESRGDGAVCPDRRLTIAIADVDAVVDLVLRVGPAGGAPAVPSQDVPLRSHPGDGGLCPPDAAPPCPATATIHLVPPDGDAPPYLAPVTVEAVDAGGAPLAAGAVERVEAVGLLDGEPRVCGDPLDAATCGWGQGVTAATFATREEGPGPAVALPLLLPGRYSFTVVPARATGLAIATVQAGEVRPAEAVRVRLGPKALATGKVTFEGRTLRGTMVRAEPVGHAGRPAAAETDADGRWALALDPGPYRLDVRPRDADHSLPWTWLDLPEDFAARPHDVAIPARARVQGRVVSGGAAVAGAVVRAFRCDGPCDAAGAAAVAVGEAVTGEDGSFAVLVPGG